MDVYHERLKIIQQCIKSFAHDVETDIFIPQMNVHQTSVEFIPQRMIQLFKQYIKDDQERQLEISRIGILQRKQDIENIKVRIEQVKREAAQKINAYVLQSHDIRRAHKKIQRQVAKIKDTLDEKALAEELRLKHWRNRKNRINSQLKQVHVISDTLKQDISSLQNYIQRNSRDQTNLLNDMKRNMAMELQSKLFIARNKIQNDVNSKVRELQAEEIGIRTENQNIESFLNGLMSIIGETNNNDYINDSVRPYDVYLSDLIGKSINKKVAEETKMAEDRRMIIQRYKQMYDDALRKKEAEVNARLEAARARERALIDKIKEATARFSSTSHFSTTTTNISFGDSMMTDTVGNISTVYSPMKSTII